MAKMVECRDFDVDCDYRVVDADGREEFILDRMEAHAHQVHADIVKDIPDVRSEIRKQLKSLAQQSHYSSDLDS